MTDEWTLKKEHLIILILGILLGLVIGELP